MTTPSSPTLIPNFEFVEHYLDCIENLPLDVQRYISQLREYDLLYRSKIDQIGRFLILYHNEKTGPGKRKCLNKIQKCLVKSQQYGDEKLNIISQIVDLVETRSQQVAKDAVSFQSDVKEDISRIINNGVAASNNHRIKLEKPLKISSEKAKILYEKPKRVRRIRTLEKIHDKVDKASRCKDELDEDEDEEMPVEEEPDIKTKKDSKKKEKEKIREKEKEKHKDEKDDKDKKEDKKVERKEKSSGKVTKRTNKQVSKIKKKKKKEKENAREDVAVDPDEPTYCVCNSISYGDMIGCDNDDCLIEWFHFGCVNLAHKPKGKWYCPGCAAERREKGKK